MSQDMRFASKCDVDHRKLYKHPLFKPLGVTIEQEVVLGDGLVLVSYTGDCPACLDRCRTHMPARLNFQAEVTGDPAEDSARLAEFFA